MDNYTCINGLGNNLIPILCKLKTFCIEGRKRKIGSSASKFLTKCVVTQKQESTSRFFICHFVAMVTAFFLFWQKKCQKFNINYCIKSRVPYTVNSRALTGGKPCINKDFLVPLKHRKLTFNIIVPGPLKLFRHTLFNCHNTINWWCNRPIKMDPLKKKMLGPVMNPVLLVRVRYSIHHAREPLVVQRGTTASYTYHYYNFIDKLRHQSLYTSSCRQTELKTMLSSYFYDVKMRVKQL